MLGSLRWLQHQRLWRWLGERYPQRLQDVGLLCPGPAGVSGEGGPGCLGRWESAPRGAPPVPGFLRGSALTLPPPGSVWYWGSCAVYDSGGYVQELGPSLEESRAQLGFLQLHNWIDNRWVLCTPTPQPCCSQRTPPVHLTLLLHPLPKPLPLPRPPASPRRRSSPLGLDPFPPAWTPAPPCPLRRSRAVFVELTRYSPAVGLHAAVTLRLEFPAAGQAVTAVSVRPFALRRLSAGLSMPLLTSVGPATPHGSTQPRSLVAKAWL